MRVVVQRKPAPVTGAVYPLSIIPVITVIILVIILVITVLVIHLLEGIMSTLAITSLHNPRFLTSGQQKSHTAETSQFCN
jgi:uncharacterized protein HemY